MGQTAFNMSETGERACVNGAEALVEALAAQEVELIFGMVGGAIMPVYDALYKAERPRHIMAGHEQGAAHMADGYARATGKPGVVMTTSGPGATNLVTGLATAMIDSIPMVAITGQVTSNLLGNDAFQEADMWGITMPVTKHNYQVAAADDLQEVVAEAFYLAMSGRPGPVLIDLPRDVCTSPCATGPAAPHAPEGYRANYRPDPAQITRALNMILSAKRPVILAGGGVVGGNAQDHLFKLATTLSIPVAHTLMGLGGFPGNHHLCLGMAGMHGAGYANLALNQADLVLAFGTRLADRTTGATAKFAPNARLIHLDVDESEINKILPADLGMVGNARPVLKALAEAAGRIAEKPDYTAWLSQVADWEREFPMVFPRRPGVIAPQFVVQKMAAMLPPETILVTGVGQHQMYAAQYYPVQRARGFISSGGLGTMGFGLPAAIGAKMARPEAPVVVIDGDGSFLMNVQELVTAVRYRVGLVVVILNNHYLGMVRQWQDLFLDGRRSETKLADHSYAAVSQAFGGLGAKVDDPGQVEQAIAWAMDQAARKSLPVVLDVAVDPEAVVLPMVPAGAANAEFMPASREAAK